MANGDGDVPAAPPLFYFKLRLVGERTHEAELDALSGLPPRAAPSPFRERAFRLTWGASTVLGTTTQDGVVTAEVDGTVDHGLLELGERGEGGVFRSRLRVPVSSRPASAQPLDELKRVLRNLGWIEDESRSALREALTRYMFRRTFVGSTASMASFRQRVPGWHVAADRVLEGGPALELIVSELHQLHDRTQRTR